MNCFSNIFSKITNYKLLGDVCGEPNKKWIMSLAIWSDDGNTNRLGLQTRDEVNKYKIIHSYGECDGVRFTVEVVAIVIASRERSTTMRKRRTSVNKVAIASSSLTQAHMMSAARAKTAALARATSSKFSLPHESWFKFAHGSKSGCWCEIILIKN